MPGRRPPYPPLELASRVFTVTGWSSDPYRAYEEIGAQTARALVGMLPEGWSFDGRRVLDFGCGAGRTLRHFLAEAQTAELWGADIDAPSIAWLQDNLCPPLRAWRSEHYPPLGLEHESFDLIWAVSVFTHLTDSWSAWLLELQRLLKPDGLLVASYMGRWNSEFAAGEPWDETRVGMNVLLHANDWNVGGPAVLMSDWWMRAHWGRAFEILRVEPQIHNMSWALLRKRDVALTTEELERPADDPREFLALRHNLRQVQREVVALEARLREQRASLQREYESSVSWRLTSPLRTAASRTRDALRRPRT